MPLHPLVVHMPIALAVLMPLVSLALLLSWWRGWLPKRAWWLAIALQGVLVGSAVVALRTGEADEERVEATRGEAAVEAHEDAAQLFTWGAGAAFALLLGAALVRAERRAQFTGAVAVAATLAVLGLGYRTGSAGGHLVYGAQGDGATASGPAAQAPGGQDDEDEEDDDDGPKSR